MGLHNFSFWASSDSFPTTDTMIMSSIVTDSVYGIDYDWNGDGSNMSGGYYVGVGCFRCKQELPSIIEVGEGI